MANSIRPENLADAINSELTVYSKDIKERVNVTGLNTIKELVKRTRATAPRGKSAKHFYSAITYEAKENGATGSKTYTWYVKPPHHALTHLLVHGHQTRNGGRTKADPFLQNALDEILPKYENDIEEAVRNG